MEAKSILYYDIVLLSLNILMLVYLLMTFRLVALYEVQCQTFILKR